MAYKNKVINNPKTGQKIKFLQTAKDTNGQLLEMVSTLSPFSKEPVEHYHPLQDEDFTVLIGELTVKIDGQPKVLKAGDTLHIAKNVVHSMWNNSSETAVVNWKVQPALDTENFLETSTGLATDCKTNERGMPNILQIAIMAKRFSHVFRLSKPSFPLQSVVFAILKPFATLAGYKAIYQEYLD